MYKENFEFSKFNNFGCLMLLILFYLFIYKVNNVSLLILGVVKNLFVIVLKFFLDKNCFL